MNNVRSVQQLNEYELQRLASSSDGKAHLGQGSWHDEYRDSAVIFVGGLDPLLTEGDVIAIFSQYGEILDINLPRFSGAPAPGTASQIDNPAAHERAVKEAQQKKGKRRGFGFLLYQDQRSTVLAVDNLNASVVLGKTMRVDHVKDYKQLSRDEDTGKMKESDEHRTNARPEMVDQSAASAGKKRSGSSDDEPLPEIDLEDPMASYIASQKRRSRNGGGPGDDGSDDDDDAEHGRRRYKTSEVVKEAQREAKKQRKEERARIREEREQRRRDRPDERVEHGANARASERRSRSRSRSPYDDRRRYRDREVDRDRDRPTRHRVDDRDRYRDRHADEERYRRR